MMKRVVSLLFIFLPILCFSQSFLDDNDYIYGIGRGDTVFSADSSAMVSLSMSLRTGVINTTSHTIEEKNNKITSVFRKEVTMDSSIEMLNTRSYIIRDGEEYVVYRYFNKQEYIDSCISRYMFYISEADRIKGSNVKHEKNLLLGCYYFAYSAIDTPIMDLYTDMSSNKADAMERAKEIYYDENYGFLAFISKKWNGYEVSMGGQIDRFGETEPIGIVGFEYFNGDKWVKPKRLSTKQNFDEGTSNNPSTDVIYRKGMVETSTPKAVYRILYEKYEGGRYIKIQVPEKWYFFPLEIQNPLFLS